VHTRVITPTGCGRARSRGPAASRQVLPPPQRTAFRAPGGGTLRCTPAFREAFTWDEVFGEDDKEQELELQVWQACAAFPPAQPPDSAPDSSTTPSAPGGPSATGAGCWTAQVQCACVCDMRDKWNGSVDLRAFR
jgi:hypothetical protein